MTLVALYRSAGKHIQRNVSSHPQQITCRHFDTLAEILQKVEDGKLSAAHATSMIRGVVSQSNDELLESFANLDHGRSKRVGFPEAVFAEGKTIAQVASILDDMAHNVNEMLRQGENDSAFPVTAILATR